MDLNTVSRREKRNAFFAAIAIGLIAMLVAAPVVSAAVQRVRVKGAVKVKGGPVKLKDTDGDRFDTKAIGPLGALEAPGSKGALDVRMFAGGTGFLGTGDCTVAEDPRPNTQTVAAGQERIITGIIVTGTDAVVSVTAPSLNPVIGPGPVSEFRANAENPNVFVGLGTGLTVFPSELVFTCTGEGGGDGDGNFVLLGQ